MTNSDQSLSVVLPVHNAQNSLPHLIHQMLDILPDVALEFEVLVVDDGSTDQTEEVARELAVQYPQVRVARHAERLGEEEVIRTGYERTRGRVVIIQQENMAFGSADLKRLWQVHEERSKAGPTLHPALHPTRLDPATEEYLSAWSATFQKKKQAFSAFHVDLLAAELEEEDRQNEGCGEEYLRTDQGGGRPTSANRSAMARQSRFRPFR